MNMEPTNCKYFTGEELDKKYPVYCKYYPEPIRINPKCILCSDNATNQLKQNKE